MTKRIEELKERVESGNISSAKYLMKEVEKVLTPEYAVYHGGRKSGKSFQFIGKLIKMLKESHDNADRMIKLCDEMELQQDEALIKIEELKHQVKNNGWIEIDRNKALPNREVVALNNKPRTYGYQEMIIGYLSFNTSEDVVECNSENEILMNVTHYMEKSFPVVKDGE